MPFYFGVVPEASWLYGNLDYSFNKHHKHYQVHDEWLPDRKGRTLGDGDGGMNSPGLIDSNGLTLVPTHIPRGCFREIRKY